MLVNYCLLLATTALVTGIPTQLPRQAEITTSALSTQPATTPIPTGTFTTTIYQTIEGVTNAHVTVPPKTLALAIPTCIPTILPDENGYVPPGECGAIWNYYPSFTGAVVLAVIFAVLAAAHIFQAVYYHKVRKLFHFPLLTPYFPPPIFKW